MAACGKCVNGVIDTGNNEIPCDCAAGNTALFRIASVDGVVTGAESRRHFHNGSPEPIATSGGRVSASTLPGRPRPFHETVVNALERVDLHGLESLLRLIEATKIPKGHDAVLGALDEVNRRLKGMSSGMRKKIRSATAAILLQKRMQEADAGN